jgi:prepilin-type N-terminal cleavage/methylation domain-containing protein
MEVAGFVKKKETSAVAGFTLLELVVVVAIIGILAMVTLPNLTKLSHKSRRAEAYRILHSAAIAQTAYFTLEGFYAPTFDQLGFEIEGGTRIDATTIQGPYYTYTLTTMTMNGVPNANYRATATGDIDPSDAVLDVLIIENQLTVVSP